MGLAKYMTMTKTHQKWTCYSFTMRLVGLALFDFPIFKEYYDE